MKNTKAHGMLLIAACIYVIYIGVTLIQQAVREKPDNMALYIAFGVVFTLVGAGFGLKNAKDLMDAKEAEGTKETKDAEKTEDAQAEPVNEIKEAADTNGKEESECE